MKEYDQFIKSVKGKGKKKETFANDFLDPKAAYMSGGQDPVTGKALPFNDPNKSKPKRPSQEEIQKTLEALRKKIVNIKDPAAKDKAFTEVYLKSVDKTNLTNRRERTPAEREANLERVINRFMQQGLSFEVARKLAMERMQD